MSPRLDVPGDRKKRSVWIVGAIFASHSNKNYTPKTVQVSQKEIESFPDRKQQSKQLHKKKPWWSWIQGK